MVLSFQIGTDEWTVLFEDIFTLNDVLLFFFINTEIIWKPVSYLNVNSPLYHICWLKCPNPLWESQVDNLTLNHSSDSVFEAKHVLLVNSGGVFHQKEGYN
jgi:hypothetical protein